MGLWCSKENQTEAEELISQNEDIPKSPYLPSFFMEDVLKAAEREQLTEHDLKLSVKCEENPEGLGGIGVFADQSFPLPF